MITNSYRFDAMTLTIFSPDYDEQDLFDYLASKNFSVREPKKTDELRKAQGYNPVNAKMILLNGEWYTLQVREEYTTDLHTGNAMLLGNTGLIALSSSEMDKVNIRDLLTRLEGGCKATRFDVALDRQFVLPRKNKKGEYEFSAENFAELDREHEGISRACGFSPDFSNGNVQNPDNDITGGRNNAKAPIRTCSKTISNGLTLYIGSRSSKFMMRVYNKTSEVKRRLDLDIPPTLRYEIEVKQEFAEAVQRLIVKSKYKHEVVAKIAWQNLTDDSLTFKNETMTDILELEKSKTVKLDYSKIDNDKMAYEVWVKRQVAPSFRRKYADLGFDEFMKKLQELFWED